MDLNIIYSIISGIISGFLIAIFFRYVFLPNETIIFRRNSKEITEILFDNIAKIDNDKNIIYSFIEKSKQISDHNIMKIIVDDFNKNQILMHMKKIHQEINQMILSEKYHMYISPEQYTCVIRYVSSFSVSLKQSESVNTLDFYVIALKHHMYYAKKIIQLFGKSCPEDFIIKWNEEFIKYGGIDNIREPSIEPNTITIHYDDINNEVSDYKSYLFIKTKLDNIDKKLNDLIATRQSS